MVRLYWSKYLKREQLEALFFPSADRCRRRLLILWENYCLDRWQIALDTGLGSSQYFYSLGPVGVYFVAGDLEVEVKDLLKIDNKQLSYLDHTIAVNECLIALTKAGLPVEEFKVEIHNRKQFEYEGKKVIFEPDALLVVGDTPYFLEVDRGTSPLQNKIPDKVRKYESYFLTNCISDYGCIPGVLFVTPENRINKTRELINSNQETDADFYVTSIESLQGNIKEKIWLTTKYNRIEIF